MRIPPFWSHGTYTNQDAKGKNRTFSAWGWSFESVEEARRDATARASRIFQHFVLGGHLERYPYATSPLREEIIDTIRDGDQDIALITRNSYGALILNTTSVLFADIDFPERKSGGGFLKKLFGGGKTPESDPVSETIEKVKNWAAANPRASFRMYRTYAGLRLLFTHKLYEPASSETDNLLAALDSDPLYRRLTRLQESFRARLTPKHWRCKCPKPPGRYPWRDNLEEQKFRQWEQTYTNRIRDYSTCTLLDVVGKAAWNDQIEEVVRLHDSHVMTGSEQLA